jgi:hypothetical protein
MMKSKSNKNIEARTSMASPKADLRELRDNSRATVQEIQSFLRELKGKGPKEMLGAIAASDLFRSVIISTALVTGAILLFTAVPYFAGDDEKKASAQTAVVEKQEKPAPPKAVESVPEAVAPAPDPLSSLGVGEELSAPPDTNPLESKGDDFLKDLE